MNDSGMYLFGNGQAGLTIRVVGGDSGVAGLAETFHESRRDSMDLQRHELVEEKHRPGDPHPPLKTRQGRESRWRRVEALKRKSPGGVPSDEEAERAANCGVFQCLLEFSHRLPPSISSRSLRIRASSSGEYEVLRTVKTN